jgi:hypothetical protein
VPRRAYLLAVKIGRCPIQRPCGGPESPEFATGHGPDLPWRWPQKTQYRSDFTLATTNERSAGGSASRPSTGRPHEKPSGAVNSAGVAGAGGHALVRMSQLALRARPYRGRTSNLWLNPAAGAGPRTQQPRRGSNLRDHDRGHDTLTLRVLIQRLLNATLGGRNLGLDIVERRFGQLGDPLCGCRCVEARGTAGG